jgi:predicted nucleotidyltransferase
MPPMTESTYELLQYLLLSVTEACAKQYGESLVSVAVFGSVGRQTPRPDSDIDLMIVAGGLPSGRMKRMAQFEAVEQALQPVVERLRAAGLTAEFSPVIKTPEEVLRGSPLLLDMTIDAKLLFDRGDFLRSALDRLRRRLQELGARRIFRGNAWFWDLKPDFKPGDVIDL